MERDKWKTYFLQLTFFFYFQYNVIYVLYSEIGFCPCLNMHKLDDKMERECDEEEDDVEKEKKKRKLE